MKPSPAAQELAELAEKLGLTEKQRLFCEALALDPERNQTKAAIAAGAKPSAATVRGSMWAARENVKQYFASLTAAVTDRANERTLAGIESTIASLDEALGAATAIMRMDPTEILGDDGEVSVAKLRDLPVEQRRALAIDIQSTTDEDGKVMARHKLKRDPVALAASKMLVDHYEGVKDTGKVVNINIERLLQVVSPEQLREANRLALMGGPDKD